MSPDDLDVSGHWTGVYSYSGSFAVVAFEARLDEALGVIAGETEETIRRKGPRLRITASLQGERETSQVTFVKRYDPPVLPGYDVPVSYRGTLSADGAEIHGEWMLPGARGTFLMIRARSLESESEWLAEAVLGIRR